MAQSLVKNYVHIVFSTKYREPLIHESIESNVFGYLGGICNKLECCPISIGGYLDHVHILCLLSKKIALMQFMEEIKSSSSKWIKTIDQQLENFYWQNGYGAFSVTPSEIGNVKKYIENQREHHRGQTFQVEFRQFLHLYEVDYDERYVWD